MTSLQGLCWLHLMKRSWGFSFFLLRPVYFCFDYCCVHFVVDLNILDILPLHIAVPFALIWRSGDFSLKFLVGQFCMASCHRQKTRGSRSEEHTSEECRSR